MGASSVFGVSTRRSPGFFSFARQRSEEATQGSAAVSRARGLKEACEAANALMPRLVEREALRLLQLPIEGGKAQSQAFGGLALIAGGAVENGPDMVAFETDEGRSKIVVVGIVFGGGA